MGRQSSDRITREVAAELCLGTGSKAFILGSISNLGGQYVIGIDAIGCSTGDTLAREWEQAAGKQDVLKALNSAASKLRTQLGESLDSVQEFDVPVGFRNLLLGFATVIDSDTGKETFRYCAILNRRSIAIVGMLSVSRLRGRLFSEHPNSKECGAFCLAEGLHG